MNANDRLALELGRTLLRAVAAETQRDEALAKLAETEKPADPEPST